MLRDSSVIELNFSRSSSVFFLFMCLLVFGVLDAGIALLIS